MKKTIFGIYKSEKQAQQLIDQLSSANFQIQDISLICSTNRMSSGKETASKNASWTKEGKVKEENLGMQHKATAALSGSMSKLNNCSTINIPGMGSYLIAGPLKGLLSSQSSSGSNGHIATALVNFGILENEAKRFEENLKKGQYILFYQNDDLNQLNKAKEIFKKTGAEDVLIATGAASEKNKKAKV